jgi:hypothetical protein
MLSSKEGATFCAQIGQQGDAQFVLRCFLRLNGEHGFLLNEFDGQSPPGPLRTEAGARQLAIEIAASCDFRPDEIVWELT